MSVTIRHSNHAMDYHDVNECLVEAVAPGHTFVNWPQPRWECMHAHEHIKGLRRVGLARAAVSGALDRVAHLGADVAWVGSDQPLSVDMGFTPQFRTDLWVRDLDRRPHHTSSYRPRRAPILPVQ